MSGYWINRYFLVGVAIIMGVAALGICEEGALQQSKVVDTSHLIPYKSDHFVILSDFDSRYVKFLQINLEAFYDGMIGEFFQNGWDKPLDIYYSKSQADTQKLLVGLGYKGAVNYAVYSDLIGAIFSHRNMTSGSTSGLGTLYNQIIYRFIDMNYKNSPIWFNEGLAAFLGEEVRCVEGKLTLGCPNPWREQRLRLMIEEGFKIEVKRMIYFNSWYFSYKEEYRHPLRALFYWMYENDFLTEYMQIVKTKGYGFEVLEEVTGKSYEQMDTELLAFIKSNCYPAAYYQDGRLSQDMTRAKTLFQKALQIKPDYYPAKLELAKCFSAEGNNQKCKELLSDILEKSYTKEYFAANETMAGIFCRQRDFAHALAYFQQAWESSQHSEYRYYNSYMTAICYHELGNSAKAKVWFDVFLSENWEPQRDINMLNFAKNYRAVESLIKTK